MRIPRRGLDLRVSEQPANHWQALTQGEEAGIILAGEFELWLGNRHYLLREGDSFRYPASIPHRYANPGQTMTRVHFTITPPFYSYKLWAPDEA